MTMRYFILGALFYIVSCSEQSKQQNSNQIFQIDTAKLFDPKSQEDSVYENASALNHCLMLDGDSIAIVLNEQKHNLNNIKELGEFLQFNSTSIGKQKFYIIYANSTSVKNVIDIIDLVKAAKIDNYKVVKLQSLFFNLNEPQ